MAIDQQDRVFMQALQQAVARVGALECGDETRGWRDAALGLLESARSGFASIVREEDREEREADEALELLKLATRGVDEAFMRLTHALELGLSQRRMSFGGFEDSVMHDLSRFLNRFHAGEFESLRPDEAVAALEQARGFAEGFVPQEHWAAIMPGVELALDQAVAARDVAAAEGAEAVVAYGQLVEGRAIARVCYLTARDLVSAALRFEGAHDRLDLTIPPIADALASAPGEFI